MVRQVKVSNFAEVQGIVSAAAKCYNEVGVHDMKGSIADAKSILGMMSLDYSHPVKIVCEDEHDLDCVIQHCASKFSCPAGWLSAPEAGIRKNRTGQLAILGRLPCFFVAWRAILPPHRACNRRSNAV